VESSGHNNTFIINFGVRMMTRVVLNYYYIVKVCMF